MSDMHISLLAAAFAALITVWLGMRCGKLRVSEKILHGDGGNSLMMKRMRAQANFVEYTPFALALIFVLELQSGHSLALGLSALAFMIGRVMHGLGMDSDKSNVLRAGGMILTIPLLIGWAIAAILVAFKVV